MALLARAGTLAALAGCYSPDLRDCTVTCASSADCAGAQVCGADHLCVQPAASGTCARIAGDAAVAMPDGGTTDAPTPRDAALPDAPGPVKLHLKVDGHGELVAGTQTCAMDCTYEVAYGVAIEIAAIAAADQRFDAWTAGPCMGSSTTICTVTPTADVTLGAKFRKVDH